MTTSLDDLYTSLNQAQDALEAAIDAATDAVAAAVAAKRVIAATRGGCQRPFECPGSAGCDGTMVGCTAGTEADDLLV